MFFQKNLVEVSLFLRRSFWVLGAAGIGASLFSLFCLFVEPAPKLSFRNEKGVAPLEETFSIEETPFHFDYRWKEMRGDLHVVQTPLHPKVGGERIELLWQGGQIPLLAPWPQKIPLDGKDAESSFHWIVLNFVRNGEFLAQVFVRDLEGKAKRVESFPLYLEPPPFSNTSSEGGPASLWREARYVGVDVMQLHYGSLERVHKFEMGPLEGAFLLEGKEGEFFAWQEGAWKKTTSFQEGILARISSESPLYIEVWDKEAYYRFPLSPRNAPPWKVQPEELFSSIRARSSHQISCLLEKQWLLLKTGDWAVRGDQKWRPLRTQEEKNLYLRGEIVGELFVFDTIEERGGVKFLIGKFCNLAKTELFAVEFPFPKKTAETKAGTGPIKKKKNR